MKIQGREALVAAAFFALLLPTAWWLIDNRDNNGTDTVPSAVVAATSAPTKHLRLVADDWCPVSCDDAGTTEGYAIDIARAVFEAAGYRVDYRLQPWARAVNDTRKGAFDVIAGILVENAPDFVYPRESIGINTNAFFTRADSTWTYRDIASLDGIIVAVANEYAFGEPFDGYVKTHREDTRRLQILFTQDPVPQGLALLEAGRVGAYLDDVMVVRWIARQQGVTMPLREAGVVSAIPLYIAFSPAHPQAGEFAAILDAGIRRLRAEGRLATILARYGLTDWAP